LHLCNDLTVRINTNFKCNHLVIYSLTFQQGETGAIGNSGDKGAPGVSGARGKRGEAGKDGYPGVVGARGVKGQPGNPTQNFIKGMRGERGEPGDSAPAPDPRQQIAVVQGHGQRGGAGERGARGEKGARGQVSDEQAMFCRSICDRYSVKNKGVLRTLRHIALLNVS